MLAHEIEFARKSSKIVEKSTQDQSKNVNLVGNCAPKLSNTIQNATLGQQKGHLRLPMCPACNILHARGGHGNPSRRFSVHFEPAWPTLDAVLGQTGCRWHPTRHPKSC